MKANNIVIIDSCPIFRLGLTILLSEFFPAHKVFNFAPEDHELSDLLNNAAQPSLVIFGLSNKIANAVQQFASIAESTSALRVVLMVAKLNGVYARFFLKYGVHGYLERRSSEADIIRAIEAVVNGNLYVDQALFEEYIHVVIAKSPFDVLSYLQMRITIFLLEGFKESEIASNLGVKVTTIYSHRYRIFGKLGVSSTPHLIELGKKHGLV